MGNQGYRWGKICLLALLAACSSSDAAPDGGIDARVIDAADPGSEFDHFTFDVRPATPLAARDFELAITAYSSTDDLTVLSYDGTVTVTASGGTLSGDTSAAITNGTATLTLQIDSPQTGITLTVTDDSDSRITGTTAAFDVSAPGTEAGAREVVISEVNWAGNAGDAGDEWIELRNTTGTEVNLSEWTVENAGPSASGTVTIPNGTVLAAGAYLVIGAMQGPDADDERTSLTGVSDVIIASLELANAGEELILKDPSGDVIDQTPTGAWPAGDADNDLSMERRDDATGGGYTDGTQAGAWYSWSPVDGTDTTNAASSDRGTPGAANTDPDLFDHYTIAVVPTEPRAGLDFTMTVTAYSSSDDSTVITSYDSTVSVTASSGTLSGQTTAQPITAGVATLTLQNDTIASGVTLTVTDDLAPGVTGSLVVDVRPEGDTATVRQVVINEVNWYGNGVDSSDEWIELRNTTGAEINVSGWTIDNLASGTNAVTIPAGTSIAAGGYLVIADQQGPDTDGMRTSVTGVTDVVVDSSVSLLNGGDPLTLRDVAGTAIDGTPTGSWPAGSNTLYISMERRDDITGGGYTDGTVAGAWYDWNEYGNSDTTSPDTADSGTPGAANSDPDAFRPPIGLPYATGFESADPTWENRLSGGYSTTPPTGITARTGTAVATTDSITTSYTGRQLQSVDCLILNNDTDPVAASGWAIATANNGGNVLRGRWRILWYDDAACATPNATTASDVTSGVIIPEDNYLEYTASITPPTGATHIKVRFEVQDNNAGTNTGDDYALDDVAVSQ